MSPNPAPKPCRTAQRPASVLLGLVFLAALLNSTVSSAAISFVQRNYAVPASGSTVSVTYTAAQKVGDTNIVAIGWSDSTSTISSVTDTKGNVYALAVGPTRQSGVQSQAIYVAKNIVAAAANGNTVQVVFSTTVPYPDVRILEYSGLDTGSPVETAVGASGTGSTSNSGSVTTSNPNDLLFAANYVTSGTTAAGAGYINRVITSPDGDIAEDRTVTAVGTYSATAIMSSGSWVMQLVALRAAGSLPVAATPTFNPVAGTYTAPQTVHLQDTTPGATIYYTLDGSTPTTSSPVYNDANPIQVNVTTTIKAIAAAAGFSNSAIATGLFTINLPVAATPTFNPPAGVYQSAQTVHILDSTPGATIYYTLDGSNPTTASPVYNDVNPIQVNVTTTIKAMASAPGYTNSAIATGVFTINLPVAATPTFNPLAGTYTAPQTVHLLDATQGATIYYTLDGSNPTTSSPVYNDASPIQVNVTTTIKAMAAAPGYNNSAIATGLFTINLPVAATPTFNPPAGTYTAPQTVHLLDATQGATIYYTLDGSNPTTSSPVYNDANPIQVNVTTTIKAMAAAPGYNNSAVATGLFTINLPVAATPTFNPPAGNYQTGQTVHILDTTPGATIYYTLDGSTPTTSSPVYNDANPIQVNVTTTIKAMAGAPGFTNSAIATGTFTIGTVAAIAFVQVNYGVPASQSTVSVTYTAAQKAGDTNIVAIGWSDSTSTISSVTDTKGNTYTAAVGPTRQNGVQSLAVYVAKNIVAAAANGNTVRVAFSTTVPFPDVRILEYSGLDTVSPLDGAVGATGTGTVSNSGSLTTTNANDLLFGANYVTSGTNAAGAGYTSRVITNPDGDIAEDRVVTATGTYNATAAMSSGNWIMQLVALKAAGALPVAATPTFNPAPGTYPVAQTVHILDSTPGATIYYTLDGSNPTTSSPVYNDANPVLVTVNTTIKAMATAPGYVNSAMATGVYTIQLPVAATPTFNPPAGTYQTAQTVHIQDATPGAIIYYSLDGSIPTTSSPVYNDANPIAVNVTTTIKAMAAASGYNNSTVATATYSIGTPVAIAFVQANYAVPTSASVVTIQYMNAQTAGNTNIVAIGWSNSTGSVTSVTDTLGNTYSPALAPTIQNGVQSQVIYIANNIAAAGGGANAVRVSFSAAVPYPDVRILEYSGLDPVSPVDGTAGASGTGNLASSGSITTSNAYDLLFGADYVTTATTGAGNGFVARVITIPDGDLAEEQIVTSAGTYTGTAAVSGGSWIMQTVALRGAGAAPPPPDPTVVGQWSPVATWPILPIHVTLMPNGKVLAFGHDATNNTTLGTVWDPTANTFQTTSFSGGDLFCAGHGLLPDGRVFVAGGHNMADYVGLKNGTVFDFATSTWTSLAKMTYGRWYPTVTSMPDGRQLVTSGAINCDGCNATIPEIYDPKTNKWSQLTSASLDVNIYPHMFVLPDGRVLNTGSYELPMATRVLDVASQTWTMVDPTVIDGGSAVMYQPGKVLKTGTSATSDPPYQGSATTAYILDMTQGSQTWRTSSSMAFPRTYHNMTSLPDGNVLVTGGVGDTNPDDYFTAALAAEMWSPTTEKFTTMASMVTPRVYHSTALLLPDGRVLVGGGGQYHGAQPDQLNAEIYSPPYLFHGARPTVTAYPNVLQYGSQFIVQTPDAANIQSVALVRLGSVTHAFNENQRYVPLSFTASSGTLTVQPPASANVAPPGYYMLFIVNNQGVPSVGVFVQYPAP